MSKNPQQPEAYSAVLGGNNAPHGALVQQLDLMIRARYPLLYIVTAEEEPVEEVLYQLAELQNQRQLLFRDIVRGWDDNNADKGSAM